MYTFDGRVRYSEIGNNGKMKLTSLINYFQDCTTFHSEDIGVGEAEVKRRKRAWILSYWQVEVQRYPVMAERITTGTFASGFEKFFGHRNFVMYDENKDWVARAYSLWLYMDVEKGRPARPLPEEISPYEVEPLPEDMVLESRKIVLPSICEDKPAFAVLRSHIDTNKHVNNCQYVQMAMNVLPEDLEVSRLRVEYTKSAVLGDTIYPKVAVETDRTVVLLCDEAGKAYAIVEVK